MSNSSDPLDPPEQSPVDRLQSAMKAALGVVPVGGAVAAELFNQLVTPPLEKRRLAWMQEVGERLQRLEAERGVDLEETQKNDLFVDTALIATQAALRTSSEEKRAALRNAILNAALPSAPEAVKQKIFVSLIDSFTDWHILVLKFLHGPEAWFATHQLPPLNISMGSLSTVIMKAIPEMAGQKPVLEQIWRDLEANGLHRSGPLATTMSGHGLMEKRTTEFADEFLSFVSDPLEPES
jgi:hypothetical protein